MCALDDDNFEAKTHIPKKVWWTLDIVHHLLLLLLFGNKNRKPFYEKLKTNSGSLIQLFRLSKLTDKKALIFIILDVVSLTMRSGPWVKYFFAFPTIKT